MTVNGGAGEILAEMEMVLGMERDTLNQELSAYWSGLLESEKTTLRSANSLWVADREDFTANPDFLQTSTDFYDADISC
jgi:serpin (serine protease inhibitor)